MTDKAERTRCRCRFGQRRCEREEGRTEYGLTHVERYRHYRPQKTAAERIDRIFVSEQADAVSVEAPLRGGN
jgi:endonuclease/exonuclease/phosphatase family metal-dependent hydrolase